MQVEFGRVDPQDYARLREHYVPLALVLDQIPGEAATAGMTEAKLTGAITVRYLRGTPLGLLQVEAWVDRTAEHKTYARGVISDARGSTVEAEGVFIMPVWSRDLR